jgi:hypothetical protein
MSGAVRRRMSLCTDMTYLVNTGTPMTCGWNQ